MISARKAYWTVNRRLMCVCMGTGRARRLGLFIYNAAAHGRSSISNSRFDVGATRRVHSRALSHVYLGSNALAEMIAMHVLNRIFMALACCFVGLIQGSAGKASAGNGSFFLPGTPNPAPYSKDK